MRRQNDARLHHIFERMSEMLRHVAKENCLHFSPSEQTIVDCMIKRKYIRKHTFDGKDYYYITEGGRQLLRNSQK